MYLVMPLFALFMTRVVSLTYAVAIAIVALSIPGSTCRARKITKYGGAGHYGLGLMVTAGDI